MRFIKFILFILLFLNVVFCLPGSSYRYGYSARSFSLSDALVADNYKTFQSFSNPASLGQAEGTNYGLSYFHMALDRSIQSFYFSKSLPGNAGLSVSIFRASVDNIMGRDAFNNSTHELSMSDYYGLLSFGLDLTQKSSIGLTMKLHYSNLNIDADHIDQYTGNSTVLDIGASYLILPKLKLGFKCENLLNPYLNWDIDIADGFSHTYSESYPLILSLGSLYSFNKGHKLMLQQDIFYFNDDKIFLTKIAYEHMLSNQLSFRCGLKGKNDFRLGFGYGFNINDKFPLLLDYSLDLGSENEGISHLFTWSFNL